MSTVKNVVICAAGLGSRLELNMPKCLVEIGGRRLIEYQLDLLRDFENIHIVVGFMEEEVMKCVKRIRKDVVFVRNPDYRTTSNSHSLNLGARGFSEGYLTLDGDILIEEDEFKRFMAKANPRETLIGITESKTEDAVYVDFDPATGVIRDFRRSPKTAYEWTGIAVIAGIEIRPEVGYVFKNLERYLPLKAARVHCFEIDTPEDLNLALQHFKPAGGG